mgnify:CR=1 FL=1
MKIRTSYVSNSSSSSYIIQGKRIYSEDVNRDNFKEIYVFGNWINDGQDVFKLSDIFMDFEEFMVYEPALNDNRMVIVKTIECEVDMGVPICKDAEAIFVVDKDYHSTQNMDEFTERYKDQIINSLRKDKKDKNKNRFRK